MNKIHKTNKQYYKMVIFIGFMKKGKRLLKVSVNKTLSK